MFSILFFTASNSSCVSTPISSSSLNFFSSSAAEKAADAVRMVTELAGKTERYRALLKEEKAVCDQLSKRADALYAADEEADVASIFADDDEEYDVVLIDTAGRLHNRIDLMNELTKIRNVMRKVVPDAPHEVLLVLDGSTGQNAFQQAKEFMRATDITALAVTKLDGTAKGGVVVGIVDQFRIPIKFVGIGEGIDDLKVFNKREFVGSLFSKEDIE